MYPKAMGYTMDDLKGISLFICMHKIMLEDDYKTSREHQRRLNPSMNEVVKNEVFKFLEGGIIIPSLIVSGLVMSKLFPRRGDASY